MAEMRGMQSQRQWNANPELRFCLKGPAPAGDTRFVGP